MNKQDRELRLKKLKEKIIMEIDKTWSGCQQPHCENSNEDVDECGYCVEHCRCDGGEEE